MTKKERTTWSNAMIGVALYCATHDNRSINNVSKMVGITWETTRRCMKTLEAIRFFEYIRLQKLLWELNDYMKDPFEAMKEAKA